MAGVVLDHGKAPVANSPATNRPSRRRRTFRRWLVPFSILSCALMLASMVLVGVGVEAAVPATIALFLGLLLISIGLCFAILLELLRNLVNALNPAQPTAKAPVDEARSALHFSPQDGPAPKPHRLGGGPAQIIENGTRSYVVVIAENGIGISPEMDYYAARGWSAGFLRDSNVRYRSIVMFDKVRSLEVDGSDVRIATRGWQNIHLAELNAAREPSQQILVRKLVDSIGLTEHPDEPGTYERAPLQDASSR